MPVAMYATVDGDAMIRCQISSQWGDRRNTSWWPIVPDAEPRFSAPDNATTRGRAQAVYEALSAAFRDDLYVTALTRPLPPPARG